MSEVRQPKPFSQLGTIGLCLSVPATLFSAGIQSQSPIITTLRFVGPLVLLGSLILRFWPGKALDENDYLTRCFGYKKFCRDRFSFAFTMCSRAGTCFVELWYQNGHSARCIPCIGLVPVSSFLQRKTGEVTQFQFQCEPGEFGVVRYAFPSISKPGSNVEFHAGVAVGLPNGAGEPLQFMGGIPVARDPELQDTAYINAATAVNLVVGNLSVKRPARVLFKVPKNISPNAAEPKESMEHQVYWKRGDTPINFNRKEINQSSMATLKW